MLKTFSFWLLIASQATSVAVAGHKFGIGEAVLPSEIGAWDIDVRGDGAGLPIGKGNAAQGEAIYLTRCAKCHGDEGVGSEKGPELKGGSGTLSTRNPLKTIGSYWPYAPTIFDYVRRAMPMGEAQSLKPDEVYAVTAYLLFINEIVSDQSAEISNLSLPKVIMPNRSGFFPDERRSSEAIFWEQKPCMRNCVP